MKHYTIKKYQCSVCKKNVLRKKKTYNIICDECKRIKINQRQKLLRKSNCNSSTHKYEKTPNGFLMRLYRNMQSRVSGIQKIKYHLYKGCDILDRKDFYSWAKLSKDFWELYKNWTKNNFDQKLTPSVNRVDSTKGYSLDNMEWITHSENSRLGALSQKRKEKI